MMFVECLLKIPLACLVTVAFAWAPLRGAEEAGSGQAAAGGTHSPAAEEVHEAASHGEGGEAASGTGGGHGHGLELDFPRPLEEYRAAEEELAANQGHAQLPLWEMLVYRATADPINLVATVIFALAIVHTFFASKLARLAHRIEHEHEARIGTIADEGQRGRRPVSFKATLIHFLGEVEAVFGIWIIPLIAAIVLMKGGGEVSGWDYATHYIDTRNFTEPMFVVIIMAIASTRPVIKFAEIRMRQFAKLGGESPAAWWLSILIWGPLLGSFITEPAAMTIAALLLSQQFYRLEPSMKFRYATLGLLFVNVSVGGTLTHFAAPPVLMVATRWDWGIEHMFTHFGWKAVVGIVMATGVYYAVFRKEFGMLKARRAEMAGREQGGGGTLEADVPVWITVVHLGFLAWTVFTLHHPPLFIGGFLFFLAFTIATAHHQFAIRIRGPLLVGFFLAALVTHGGMQGWWIAPVLSALGEVPLFAGATVLTAFNDNAAITFLASQVPQFEGEVMLQYAVVAGAVTGGGLTVIANAPNPAGQSILSQHFGNAISPLCLLAGAVIPTMILAGCYMLLPY